MDGWEEGVYFLTCCPCAQVCSTNAVCTEIVVCSKSGEVVRTVGNQKSCAQCPANGMRSSRPRMRPLAWPVLFAMFTGLA